MSTNEVTIMYRALSIVYPLDDPGRRINGTYLADPKDAHQIGEISPAAADFLQFIALGTNSVTLSRGVLNSLRSMERAFVGIGA